MRRIFKTSRLALAFGLWALSVTPALGAGGCPSDPNAPENQRCFFVGLWGMTPPSYRGTAYKDLWGNDLYDLVARYAVESSSQASQWIAHRGTKSGARDAVQAWKSDPKNRCGKVIVTGFSRGAVAANDLAESLGDKGVAVDLLFLLDPVIFAGSLSAPKNAKRCIDVYQQTMKPRLLDGQSYNGTPAGGCENFKIPEATHSNTIVKAAARHLLAEMRKLCGYEKPKAADARIVELLKELNAKRGGREPPCR